MTSKNHKDIILNLPGRLFTPIEIDELGMAYCCFGEKSVFIYLPEVRRSGQTHHLRGFFGFGLLPLNEDALAGGIRKDGFSFIPVENVPDFVRASEIKDSEATEDLQNILASLATSFRNQELQLTDVIRSIATVKGPAIYPSLGRLLKDLQGSSNGI